MALSNTFREPRREITESSVGIAVFGLLLCAPTLIACRLAVWFQSTDGPTHGPFAAYFVLAVVAELVAGAALIGLLFLTHAIGEGICNSLARRGVELRPKQRYNR